MSTSLSLSGLLPPLTTPFDPTGAVALDWFAENVRRLAGEPLTGYVVGGSNGEFSSLTLDERVNLVRTARRVAGPRLVLAGAGMESTRATIDLTRRMADAGADAALVVTPGFFKARMTPAALERHYSEV